MMRMMMTMMNKLNQYDFIISMAEMFYDNTFDMNSKKFIYMHPIENPNIINSVSKHIKYEAGCEEAVLALLLDSFCENDEIKEKLNEFDIGYLSAESNVGEEEIEEIYEDSKNYSKFAFYVGEEVFVHENSENIKAFLSAIDSSTKFDVISKNDFISQQEIEEVEELDTYNGTVLFTCVDRIETNVVVASASFAKVAKSNSGDTIEISFKEEKIQAKLLVDESLKGTIGLYSFNNQNILNQGYPYKQVRIKKVDL